MKLETALDCYLVQSAADGRSEHTQAQAKRHVRLFSRWLTEAGHVAAVNAITHEQVAGFLASPLARRRADGGERAPTSANAMRSSLRSFLAYCRDAGYAPLDAGRLIRRARCQPPPPRGISAAEQQRLLEALQEAQGRAARRDRVLIHLLLRAGLRLGSALGLDIEDLDLEQGEAVIRTSKGAAPSVAILGEDLVDLLREHVGGRTSGPLIVANHGRRLGHRQVRRRLSLWLEQAGVRRGSPHACRHAFALDLYQRTGDIALVQAALGHRSITSTTVYAYADRDRLRAALCSSSEQRGLDHDRPRNLRPKRFLQD